MNTFEEVFTKNQYNLQVAAGKSQAWFQQQARLLARQNIQPLKLVNAAQQLNTANVVPGSMYLFMYDALHADKLPYWDMFPLVFPFRKVPNGFIGLNLHYAPYKLRVSILDRLMQFSTTKNLTEHTRIKFSWELISGVASLNAAKPCVHRYLMSQVQTPFKRIDPADWTTALLLPVERFVGSSKQRVWSDTLNA